jgi:hypothetical protein
MDLGEDNAASHRGKDAAAVVATGRGVIPVYGMKSRRPARRSTDRLEPRPGHSPDLVDLADDKKQLPLTDPSAPMHDAPKDAELFE